MKPNISYCKLLTIDFFFLNVDISKSKFGRENFKFLCYSMWCTKYNRSMIMGLEDIDGMVFL